MGAPEYERAFVVRCPHCKNEHAGPDNKQPITIVESATHVYILRFTEDGEIEPSWFTTTDGEEDYRFLCNNCGHEWEVPKCFKITFG